MLTEAQRQDLQQRFGERLSLSASVREAHGRDESFYPPAPPDAVLMAETEAEVLAAVAWCHRERVPLIPFGAGTSLEGHVLAVHGGLCLDLTRMDAILRIDAADLTVTVQPGVTREQLNAQLRDQGLFFPIDPGANATLGGMAGTRASGTNAVRYGTMRENVLMLRAVLPPGQVLRCGSRARKSSAGYDLARLLVGSEGTLGVITELTLKLHPLPEQVAAASVQFPSIAAAVQACITVIQSGIPIARCELIDANAVRAVNAADHLGLPESPMLLLEFHGSPLGVREQVERVQALAAEQGGTRFDWAATPEARSRLWQARHRAYWSAIQTRPGCRCLTTDVCVPISRLAECVDQTLAEAEAEGLPYFVVGHVGDGNFHVGFLIVDAAEREQAQALSDRMVQRALRLDGSCSGEHGIGLHKQAYLLQEAGEPALAAMRAIKAALDPHGVMNPGKVFAAS
ncbi:FAD-binding oxidoreductase [Pseudorhodoferax sp.]|uniref:FAD-binding oxidoreductase n=1 Tax=Pseudorhodoferax sp. TaxID=1993553 RepID=UPI001B763F26|nr:FAD-linked oxidase C-terminal domain-containing protein [Pseudorhodoferax sp.]MBP8145483.1 FAD-binding protein [Inhella sp.]